MMIMIVNLYSTLRKNASTVLRVAVRCEEECLSADLKKLELSDGSQRRSGKKVPCSWICNGESPSSKSAAVMSCNRCVL